MVEASALKSLLFKGNDNVGSLRGIIGQTTTSGVQPKPKETHT
jgi:hypothetical protein